jgi:hypothetical protein
VTQPDFNRLNPSPTAPRIIGLAGYARSGKDTVGEIINRLYGHQVLSFSDILREFLYAQDLHIPTFRGSARLNDLVDDLGWEEARNQYPYIRTLQQKTGAEAGRGVVAQDVWVNAWAERVRSGGLWVSPSVRYPNEGEVISYQGGVVLQVRRPGVGPVNDHISDRALDGHTFDAVILNDGTLTDLEGEVQRVLGEFS